MIIEFKKGIIRGIATLLVVGGGLFAFQVSGTIKTWTTGETLTASDLNTTVQSLKTAVEGATQIGVSSFEVTSGTAPNTLYSPFIGNTFVYSSTSEAQAQTLMNRTGTIKNVRANIVTACTVAATITLRVNGADSAISLTLPAGSTTPVTTATTVTFAANDLLAWKYVCTNGSLRGTTTFDFQF